MEYVWYAGGVKEGRAMFITENQTNTILIAEPCQALENKYPGYTQIVAELEEKAKPYCSIIKLPAKDVWMRDFCPVLTDKGGYVGFWYLPDYQGKKHSIETQNSIIGVFKDIHYLDVIMDGGHFVYNGKGVIMVSEKVLKLNTLNKDQITSVIQSVGFNKVVWLPYDPTEKTGHLDGTMQFLDDETLIINSDSDKEERLALLYAKYCRIIKQQCPDLKLVPIRTIYDKTIRYGWQSARGLYTNFVQTKNALFLPVYGIETDEAAIATFKQHTDKPIIPIHMAKLAKWGGSLHCMTANT